MSNIQEKMKEAQEKAQARANALAREIEKEPGGARKTGGRITTQEKVAALVKEIENKTNNPPPPVLEPELKLNRDKEMWEKVNGNQDAANRQWG